MPSSLLSRVRFGLAVALLALTPFGTGAQAARSPQLARGVEVVGSGHLDRTVIVRSAPRQDARRVTVLKEFRSEYRPQIVLAVSQRVDPETGEPRWYR
ncbi:MAG: hypothetical protein ACJ777_12315, partial [Chloroflexota bacterium]